VSRPLPAPREDFPVLSQRVNGRPLAYLDSAATAQKPARVIDAVADFYRHDNANIHRAVYGLGERATARYEGARERVASFLNAREAREVVFVRGATEGINLVASCLSASLRPGDEVLITALEHHANIVPWQLACARSGAALRVLPMTPSCDLDLSALDDLLTPRTRLFAFSQLSNALGTVNPAPLLCARARAVGALTLVDGAQAAAHGPTDVQALGCDFYVFSGHKLYGPTGVGVLYGRAEVLEALPPYQGGGDMIEEVRFEGTTFAGLPSRFEAGTPHICGAVGLGVALDYLREFDLARVEAHEAALLAALEGGLRALPGVRVMGAPAARASAVSFVLEGAHPHDVGVLLDQHGVAVRVGHHCAQPVMRHLGVSATVRASVGLYTSREDVAQLLEALPRVRRMLVD
jgi:SufS family cysteine desulfurase